MQSVRSQFHVRLAPCHPFRTTKAISRIRLQQTRNFHPTKKSPFINEVLDISSGFLHSVHAITGLPWVASIPLTAFLVRMVVAMPLQIYSRIHARREHDLSPLVMSWRKHFENKTYQRENWTRQVSNGKPLLPEDATTLIRLETHKKLKSLRKNWKVARFWRLAAFLQVPVWLSLMESLRAMCGNNRGLVPYLLSLLEPSSSSAISPVHLTVEPSLALEGGLWFPDLLAGDSTGILPLFLSLSILLNVSQGWKSPTLRELSDYPTLEMRRQIVLRILKSLIQLMAINIGITSYTYGMPCGLMIYWITSSNIATLQSLSLDKYMFAKPPLKPWVKVYVGLLSPIEMKPTLKSP